MAAEQRKLLEQLMGDNLMSMPGTASKQAQLSISDPSVCRSYLCGSCPHDLFTNTKQDLGQCKKAHVPNLKEEYLAKSDDEKHQLGFDFDYMRDISRYVSDCDRRIDSAQKRLEKTPDEQRQTNALLEQISGHTKQIDAGLVEVEVLAESGAVSMAVHEFHKVRVHKMSKEDRERELKALSDTSGPSGHQKLQVCDVCGAYLSRLDNDRRLADHFFGKMHLGYAAMRKEMEKLTKELKGRQPPQTNYHQDDDRHGGYGDGGYQGHRRGGGGGGYGGGRGGYGGGGRGRGRW
ncbi:hypothetical protein AMS68_007494 [Peltaster fructicola]|uniref:Uncharacterized protein n=1 Tax=Peltaster fructicola TaxID=286661 RepID=A0A6H0Y4L9_9PEZI|nr:hypothetical protein AMS68_007494 [Peltaster fructicola]